MIGSLTRWFSVAFWLLISGSSGADTLYSFGVVPQFEPGKLASIWLPILKGLEKETGLRFRMVGSPRIFEFEKAFMAGKFDFAYMNPYHALLAGEAQGYVPLVRDHGRELSGILVVRKDADVTSPKDLDGQRIAFPSPNALGASLLMRADLTRSFGIRFRSEYVKTHSSVYLHVALGRVAAGGGVYSTLQRQPTQIRDRLRIIHETRKLAPHPVTAHPRVPETDREAVRRAFLAMGRTGPGKGLLSKVPILAMGKAELEDYRDLKDLELQAFFRETDGDED